MLIVTHCGIFVVGTICAILRQLECIKAIKELTNTAGDTPHLRTGEGFPSGHHNSFSTPQMLSTFPFIYRV